MLETIIMAKTLNIKDFIFKIFFYKKLFFIGLMMSLLTPSFAMSANLNNKESIVSTATLTKIPKEKATIGVIPYVIKDKQIYILLGRERIDGLKKERAGKFSDFGGTVEVDGSSLIANAVNELKEESMNQMIVSEEDLLSKGKVIYKLSSKNREIFYIFYPMSEQEYNTTKNLDSLWPKLCQHTVEAEECEKDKFVWLNANDLKNKQEKVTDIDGNERSIKLREFFVSDCIEHPEFNTILQSLVLNNNKAIKP